AATDLSRSLDRYLGRGDSEPDLASHEIRQGDRLLFCTDGVYRPVSHETLTNALVNGGSPAQVAELLIEAAREAGGTDDATAVVADIGIKADTILSLTSSVGG